MINLAKRNLYIYFRSPSNVLLSLMATLIVLLVYILFLGGNYGADYPMLDNGSLFMNTWLLAGMCALAPLSTSLSIVSAIIADRMQGVDRDFLASPVARYKIAGGYLISGATGSFIVTCTVFIISLVWLVLSGAAAPTLTILVKCLVIIALTCICSSCITFFIASLIRKSGAYNSIGTIVGTLGGFLSAIYLPFGQLPAAMQEVVKLFPPSHAAVLMRSTLLEGISSVSYASTPTADLAKVFEYLGVRLSSSNGLIPLWTSLAVLIGCSILFFGLSCWSVAYKRRK